MGSCLKGVDTGLIIADNKEFSDQVMVFKFYGERFLRT
jgi:hypothetical protein